MTARASLEDVLRAWKELPERWTEDLTLKQIRKHPDFLELDWGSGDLDYGPLDEDLPEGPRGVGQGQGEFMDPWKPLPAEMDHDPFLTAAWLASLGQRYASNPAAHQELWSYTSEAREAERVRPDKDLRTLCGGCHHDLLAFHGLCMWRTASDSAVGLRLIRRLPKETT